MMPHEPTHAPHPQIPEPEGKRAALPMILMAAMFLALIGGGLFTVRDNFGPSRDDQGGMEESVPPDNDYPLDHKQWQPPQFALILSGQMHGFTDKCGCSDPQYGGLPRRWNFVQSLKARGWDVAGIDLGELPQLKGIHEQNRLKFELTIRSLTSMNYKAFGIGRDEILLPLGEGLSQIWLENVNYPRPISTNLAKAAPGGQYHGLNARPYEIFTVNNGDKKTPSVKVGVVNLIGEG